MMKRFLLDVFVPDHSKGLMVDALVVKEAIGADRVRIISVPVKACKNTISTNDRDLRFEPEADIAVFIERLFPHGNFQSYSKRVFVPNPEWLTALDIKIARSMIDEIWHKSRFGLKLLNGIFPEKIHRYVGFTSLRSPSSVRSYERFAHFSGKSRTRHKQDIIDLWLNNPDLPALTLPAYGEAISIPRWVVCGNLRFFLGFLKDADLQREFTAHGIHLCTSQMEGFGHYINESRSVGALVVTMDAPPMNELIDETCGVLIAPAKAVPHNFGTRFIATPESIRDAVMRVLRMPVDVRKELGSRARARFVKEREEFSQNLKSIVFPGC